MAGYEKSLQFLDAELAAGRITSAEHRKERLELARNLQDELSDLKREKYENHYGNR